MTIYNCDYCVCKNPEPEEIKRGVIICLACEKEMNPADISEDAPEPSEEDFSTCNDLVPDDSAEYEDMREAEQVSYEGGRL